MDYRCSNDRSVGVGVGDQQYDGWVYPYPAGDCHCRCSGQDNPGAEPLLVRLKNNADQEKQVY